MITAAIYARYSSEQQRETSIDDQIHKARQRIQQEGWTDAGVYTDQATSGSVPVTQRPGGRELIAAAVSGEFNILLIEGLDRLSRNLGEQERIVEQLEYAGIRIIGLADSYDSDSGSRKLHRGMRGLINAVYIDDLREKTHRGLSGQFERGLFAGGISYGYRSVEVEGGHKLEIDEDQAAIVRWIFEEYAGGQSHRSIAVELNRLGTPSPRGGQWSLSAIYGSPSKGTGILNNELYTGTYIWNRSRWEKNPATGKRRRVERPPHEWLRREIPELRIIEPALWDAVKARQKATSAYRSNGGKPAKTLLSGLMRCKACGGPIIAVDRYCYGCGHQNNRGTCDPRIRVSRETAEQKIVALLRDEILGDDCISELQDLVRAELKRRKATNQIEVIDKQIAETDREIDHLVDAIARTGWSQPLNERLSAAERRKAVLQEERRQLRQQRIPDIMPNLKQRLHDYRTDLEYNLKRDTERARESIRAALGEVYITREDDGAIYADVEMKGSQLLAAAGIACNAGSGGALFCWKRRLLLVEGRPRSLNAINSS